ncbi:MAG TPA: methyltransferase domain-containing protein [Casimicrobiaceae bacterium]|jgi:SAM-dependent methyltransferase|nr:methyltransferase domain-containing protein [Casimicrobiaceae bacterium]
MTRLNLGCGPFAPPGWINCDIVDEQGVGVRADLRRGLPFAVASVDCIAAIHVLQDLEWVCIAPALDELVRVLKPGGVLRLAVPDLDRAIDAYRAGDARYFYVPDRDARDVGAKLVTQIIWYGSVRTPCTFGFLKEWLANAGFDEITRRSFGVSAVDGLAELDNRERETLFVEATKPRARST